MDKIFYNNIEKNSKIKGREEELKKHYRKYLSKFWRDDKMESYKKNN